MPATQFPQYTYLAGAASVAPRGHGNPMIEQQARRAILLAFTIAEAEKMKPAYDDGFANPRSEDAVRIDAMLAKHISPQSEPALFATLRQRVTSALNSGWGNYMANETRGQGRSFRSATPAPDLMALAVAHRLAKNVTVNPAQYAPAAAPAIADPNITANDPRVPVPRAPRDATRPQVTAQQTPRRAEPEQPSLFDVLGVAA